MNSTKPLGTHLRARSSQLLLSFAGLIFITSVGGCGSLDSISAAAEYEKRYAEAMPKETMVVTRAPVPMAASIGARKFALMALFSRLVYLKHLPEKDRNDPNCQKYNENHPIRVIDDRYSKIATNGERIAGWRRWDGVNACFNGNGLYFEVYVFAKAPTKIGEIGQIKEAVIAYRGTESYGHQVVEDWSTNVSAALGFDPIEYKEARRHIHDTIRELLSINPHMPIYLTGHSLGGGLAQQSAYLTERYEVSGTYVFNTDPVSNWSYLMKIPGEIRNQDPKIIRIQERGEAAAFIRWVTSRVNFRRFGRSDYEFNFSKKRDPLNLHSMAILACNMARIWDAGQVTEHQSSDKADAHYFTREMAHNILIPQVQPEGKGVEPICPDGIWDK